MAYGLQVYNSAGYVQIDETYRNYLKVAQGWGSASTWEITFPSQTSALPLVFYRPASDSVTVNPAYILSDRFNVFADGAFEYMVFGLDNVVIDSGSHGLQVFNSSAQRISDSRNEGLRIQHVLRQPMKTSPPVQGPNNFPMTLYYPSWGTRPWLCASSMMVANGEETSNVIFARTQGLNAIVVSSQSSTQTNDPMVGYFANEMVIPLGRTYW